MAEKIVETRDKTRFSHLPWSRQRVDDTPFGGVGLRDGQRAHLDPNTPLFKRLDAQKGCDLSAALMSPHELQMGMEWAARQLYSLPSILERMARREPVCGGTWQHQIDLVLANWLARDGSDCEIFINDLDRAFLATGGQSIGQRLCERDQARRDRLRRHRPAARSAG
jgi:hypothetical protein